MTSRLMSLLVATLAIGCSGADTARESDTTTSTSTGMAATADAQLGDLTDYRLTMDNVRKYGRAVQNIQVAARTIPESDQPNLNAANSSLDGYVQQLDRHPAVRDAIRRADISTRDFAYTMMAMLQAGMADAVIQMRPDVNADSLAREMKVNPANIRFVRENKAEIEAMQQQMGDMDPDGP